MNNPYFLDTSALIKRYVQERGTKYVCAITKPKEGRLLIVSRLAWREILHAVTHSQREGGLTHESANQIIQSLCDHLGKQYYVVEPSQALFSIEADLLSKYSLRIDDAIQLASALWVKQAIHDMGNNLIFVSADDHLLDAANAEGLKIQNPNHPSPTIDESS